MGKNLIDIETDKRLEKEDTVMNLAVIQGGKSLGGGGSEENPDWLSTLEVGTIFLVEEKGNPKQFALAQFQVVDKTEKAVYLVSRLNEVIQTFVKPMSFCNQYRLFEVLGVITQEAVVEEKENE